MTPLALTDSGLETWLTFHRGIDLVDFAAFPLLDDPFLRVHLVDYYREHVEVASRVGAELVLGTPTWRASTDWGDRLGYDPAALDRVNRDAVLLVRAVAFESPEVPVRVSGVIGPRQDAYHRDHLMAAEEAQAYHLSQIASFAAAGADRVTMLTATHVPEAVGVIRAARLVGIDCVVGFTVEVDGRTASGQPLHEAILEADVRTDESALYFGVNCAHPDHFGDELRVDARVASRVGMIRANASRRSSAELDLAEPLDEGDADELAGQYADLVHAIDSLEVLGGCCGTDSRHVEAIARACMA